MFILTACNITQEPNGKQVLAHSDGSAEYDVWVGINQRMIWKGTLSGHIRSHGGAALLRLIADRMEGK